MSTKNCLLRLLRTMKTRLLGKNYSQRQDALAYHRQQKLSDEQRAILLLLPLKPVSYHTHVHQDWPLNGWRCEVLTKNRDGVAQWYKLDVWSKKRLISTHLFDRKELLDEMLTALRDQAKATIQEDMIQ